MKPVAPQRTTAIGFVRAPCRAYLFLVRRFQYVQRSVGNEEVSSSRNSDHPKKRGRGASEALENLCEWLQRKSLPHRMDEVRTGCAVSGAGQEPSACRLSGRRS